jgi:hypothetical protein
MTGMIHVPKKFERELDRAYLEICVKPLKYKKVTTNRYMVQQNDDQFVCWIEKTLVGYCVDYIHNRKSFSFNSLQEAKTFIEASLQ